MIKAVFFDWMNTLTHAEPDRHEQLCQIAQELGIELSPQKANYELTSLLGLNCQREPPTDGRNRMILRFLSAI